MKGRRELLPHHGGNLSLTLLRMHRRIRTIDPTYKPGTIAQGRVQIKRAERCARMRVVR